jgi:hypothetical protein
VKTFAYRFERRRPLRHMNQPDYSERPFAPNKARPSREALQSPRRVPGNRDDQAGARLARSRVGHARHRAPPMGIRQPATARLQPMSLAQFNSPMNNSKSRQPFIARVDGRWPDRATAPPQVRTTAAVGWVIRRLGGRLLGLVVLGAR